MDFGSMVQRPRLRLADGPLLAWRTLRYRATWFEPERLL
jgi:hypothetical protein